MIGATVCAALFFHSNPVPGVSVAIMGFAAALLAARTKANGREKATWMLIIAALLVIEIVAIRKDRSEAYATQAKVLEEEKQRFSDIGKRIEAGMERAQAQFKSTMVELQVNLRTVTGGDSYCYADFANESPDHKTKLLLVLCRGKYPVRDVRLRLVDQDAASEIMKKIGPNLSALQQSETQFSIGDLAAGHSTMLGFRDLSGHDRFNFLADFSALNGSWQEEIRLRMGKGTWQQALRVSRYMPGEGTRPPRYEVVFSPPPSPDYPLVNGKVDW